MNHLRVIYYSHGLNTARFVHRHLLPELAEQFPSASVLVERVFSDSPTRPITGRSFQHAEREPTEVPEHFLSLHTNDPSDVVTSLILAGIKHTTILVAPVYRDWQRYPGTQVHPEPVRQAVRDIRSRGGVIDGYIAAGNMNFGTAAYGGKTALPGPLLGTLDLSGNLEVARDCVDRLQEVK